MEIVVPRRKLFKRVTRDEALAVAIVVVDACRMWVRWDNGLLAARHDECWRWGSRTECGIEGGRGRAYGLQRSSFMGGGLIMIAMRLNSIVEILHH